MTLETRLYTIDEAMTLDPYPRWELVRGRIVELNYPQLGHIMISSYVSWLLYDFGVRTGRGWAAQDYSFVTERNPDTFRVPDCIFISNTRNARNPIIGVYRIAPELAVEVKSPSNSRAELYAKAIEYLAAGTDRVWVVDPDRREIRVYRAASDYDDLTADDMLIGDGILDGFSVLVRDIVDRGRREEITHDN